MAGDKEHLFDKDEYQRQIKREMAKLNSQQFANAGPAALGPEITNAGLRTNLLPISTQFEGVGFAIQDYGTIGFVTQNIDFDFLGSKYNIFDLNGDITFGFKNFPLNRAEIFTVDISISTATPPVIIWPASVKNLPINLPTASGSRYILHMAGYRNDNEEVYHVIGGSTGSILPAGTAENQHLEWDNTGLKWDAVQSSEYGATGPHADSGFLRFANDNIMTSQRNAADTGNLEFKVSTLDEFDFTNSLNSTVVDLVIRAQHATNPDAKFIIRQDFDDGASGDLTTLIFPESVLFLRGAIPVFTIGPSEIDALLDVDMNLGDIRNITLISGRDDATPFKIIFDVNEDADTFISDDTATADRINVTAGGVAFWSWLNDGTDKIVGITTGSDGILTISDGQLNMLARVVPPDVDIANDEMTIYGDTATDPLRLLFKRKTVAGIVSTGTFVYTPFDIDIVMAGATLGATNIGHLDFVDNTATPAATFSIYSDGTDLFANTGSHVTNLDALMENPAIADLDMANNSVINSNDFNLVRDDGTARMNIIGGVAASAQVLFDAVTGIDIRFTEALADRFEIRNSNNTIRMHVAVDFENNGITSVANIAATSGVIDFITTNSSATVAGYRDLGHTADPTGPLAGELYYNTTINEYKFFNGTVWATLGGGGSSFADDVFDIHDNVTPTKIFQFNLGGLAVGTTTFDINNTAARIYTFPDITGTMAMLSGTQTFTGTKTFGDIKVDEVQFVSDPIVVFMLFHAGGIDANVAATGDAFRVRHGGSLTFQVAPTEIQLNKNIVVSGSMRFQHATDSYLEFADIVTPSTPPATLMKLYMDSTSGNLTVLKPGGATIDLETVGGVDPGDNVTWTGIHTFTNAIHNINSATIGLGDSGADRVNFIARINSDLIPNAANSRDLGSASLSFSRLYLGNTSTARLRIPVGSNLFD